MFIRDYFDIVNTGERLYSVILDEDELRMFDEISSEEEQQEETPAPAPSKKKKLLKGAAVGGAAAAGAGAGYLGARYAAGKIAHSIAKKAASKDPTASGLDPKQLSTHIGVQADKLLAKNRGKVMAGKVAAGTALGLAAGYGAYKYLKNRNKKNEGGGQPQQ